MKFNVKYDLDQDVYRYYYTASKISQGLYGNKFFYVLPSLDGLTKRIASNSVHFPKLDFIEKHDWDVLKKTDVSINLSILKTFDNYNKVRNYFNENFQVSQEQIVIAEKNWKEVQHTFENTCKSLITHFPEYDNVNIFITRIGTVSSYNIYKNRLIIYYRLGSDISNIAEVIIAANIVRFNRSFSLPVRLHYGHGIDWIITESIVDFLMLHSKLKTLFPTFIPTLEGTNFSEHPEIAKRSIKYLRELGYGPQDSLIIDNDVVKNQDGQIIKGLNNQEFKILKLLIDNKNSVCTYEAMAKELWQEDYLEKFSMYALNKIIFQIRQKLKMNKAHNANIKTKRNSGYVLYF